MTSQFYSYVVNEFKTKLPQVAEFIEIIKQNKELENEVRLTERVDAIWKDVCIYEPKLNKPEYKVYFLLLMSEFLLSKI